MAEHRKMRTENNRKRILIAAVLTAAILLMTGCSANSSGSGGNSKAGGIDMDVFESIEGDYYVIWNDELEEKYDSYEGYWRLSIGEFDVNDDDKEVPYFACIDVEAGNPGFEGEIISLSENSITIRIDFDLYEVMPFDWEPDEDGLVELEIAKDGDILELSSGGKTLAFHKANY